MQNADAALVSPVSRDHPCLHPEFCILHCGIARSGTGSAPARRTQPDGSSDRHRCLERTAETESGDVCAAAESANAARHGAEGRDRAHSEAWRLFRAQACGHGVCLLPMTDALPVDVEWHLVGAEGATDRAWQGIRDSHCYCLSSLFSHVRISHKKRYTHAI